ncbi:MAG: hypothetical protein LQ337_002205 [Flavoplaca oasis]|nr:MAG: hypothetical protein LQ337_002205 [Flavoplaca oasis]
MSPIISDYPVISPTTPSSTNCDTTAVQPTDQPGRFGLRKKKSKSPPPCVNLKKNTFPQAAVDKFWRDFTSKKPGKTFAILPGNVRAKRAAIKASIHAETPTNAVASYEQAAEACKAEIENIVRDCLRMNQKYKDPDFDIEWDLSRWLRCHHVEDCLVPLGKEEAALRPRSVKRVEDIFENPHSDGMCANDVRQGQNGDCWLMSALCALSNSRGLLDKVCAARDEKVGVYGFVFHRDGEWKHVIVDDKLYLTQENFHESVQQRQDWDRINMVDAEEEYRKVMQTGSKALYFAKCKDENTTWLPLLEKAYAKAHGDYGSIEGGWNGEALEELTGGVTSELFSSDILDKDKFWNEELMKVNESYLFGLAQMGGCRDEEKGIVVGHAYSIMEAKELDEFRLLKIRNPWGNHGWNGPWGDGSEEWTPDRMKRLNHTFRNDGSFWICYQDLLKRFQHIDRTQLFGSDWSVTQRWTSAEIPWSIQYLATSFRVTISKPSRVVIVLCQLDDRYFQGLDGQYTYSLHFRVSKADGKGFIAENKPSYFQRRSATTELVLEAGQYSVMVKIIATRYESLPTPEDIVIRNCKTRPKKLQAIGRSYDIAHAKGGLKESGLEREERLRKQRREKRKVKAREAFEQYRQFRKKEKLRKMRMKAKDKSSVEEQGKGDLTIRVNMPGTPQKHKAKGYKVTIETVDNDKQVGNSIRVPDDGHVTNPKSKTQIESSPQDAKTSNDNKVHTETTHEEETGKPPPAELTLDDISDDGLSWSSDIDAPPDSDSEESDESDSDGDSSGKPPPSIRVDKEKTASKDDKESSSKGPWNAVCVFGLRVYAKEAQAEIEVLRESNEGKMVKIQSEDWRAAAGG